MSSASKEVQMLSRYLVKDIRSVTAKNIQLIKELTNLDPLNTSSMKMKKALVAAEIVAVPEVDSWRLPYLRTLLAQRGIAHNLAIKTDVMELGQLIDSLVIN